MTTALHTTTGERGTSDVTREIRDALDRLEALNRETADYLKALAFILHRVAIADDYVCDQETDRMEQILVDHASLSRSQAILAVEIARHCGQIADCGCSYEASRKMRKRLGEDDGRLIHDFLESVAAADGQVLRSEKAQIRQIAVELGLPS
jgi:tellurite resistance protein